MGAPENRISAFSKKKTNKHKIFILFSNQKNKKMGPLAFHRQQREQHEAMDRIRAALAWNSAYRAWLFSTSRSAPS